MSRLLLAKAARVCCWHDCDAWPELLTARELARLQGDHDLEAILPPEGAGLLPERPRYAASPRGGYSTSAAARLVPAYDAAMVRPLLAGVELSPMLAAWLEVHAPQDAPQAEPARAEPQAKPRAFTQERAAHLAAVLDEIEARAVEANHPFNRAEWPGTKAEFMAFLRWKNSYLAHRLQTHKDRLSEELRPHGVTFLPGNNKGKGLRFYRALYSDYRPA